MRSAACIGCDQFPCSDVNHAGYQVPNIDLDPQTVRIVLISEAAPPDKGDYYYAAGNPLFAQTTVQAFQDAASIAASEAFIDALVSTPSIESVEDLLRLGIYLTTAVKCSKTDYGIQTSTIEACSKILEAELALFPQVKAYLLMGDVAIKAVNAIAKRNGQPRVIPAGATYKIRGGQFFFHGVPALPSYLQAGPSFFIEKSKRKMIAEDLAAALKRIRAN
jgi:uracil-DNA glycosylase